MRLLPAMLTVLAAAAALAAPAAAHPGHDALTGFAAGFAHPFGGIDHLLAMIAVGAWAAQQGGRAAWALPAAFVVTMALGGAAALFGAGIAGTESFLVASVLMLGAVIVASVLMLGAVIAAAAKPPLWFAAPLVAAFAFFHGLAHGGELLNAAEAAPYVAGFIAATALLHAGGIALAFALRGSALRLAGIAQIGAGMLLATGAF